MKVYNTQNQRVSELCPSSGVLFLELDAFLSLGQGVGAYYVGSSE
jgi:hypothetical protein